MVIETARPIAEVARGIHDGTLGNWVNTCRLEHPEPRSPRRWSART